MGSRITRQSPSAGSHHLDLASCAATLGMLTALTTGCTESHPSAAIASDSSFDESAPPINTSGSDGGDASPADVTETALGSAPPDAGPSARCSPAPGTTGRPRTVIDVVNLINGLPMPVDITCFLQSLERPLKLFATFSVISAQPAAGQNNPRLFLIGDGLSLSVVPAGDGRNLLEMGEMKDTTRSIKAEVEFPITKPLDISAPFTRIARGDGEGTVCEGCHFPESEALDYPVGGAFESIAYRPVPRYEINFDYVEYQYTNCDFDAEPERCAFFAALFGQGGVSRGEFPAAMPTFE